MKKQDTVHRAIPTGYDNSQHAECNISQYKLVLAANFSGTTFLSEKISFDVALPVKLHTNHLANANNPISFRGFPPKHISAQSPLSLSLTVLPCQETYEHTCR